MQAPGDVGFLTHYLETLIKTLQNSFSRNFTAVIFQGDAPLRVVALQPDNSHQSSFQVAVEQSQQKLDAILRDVDQLLTEQQSPGVFIQRIARVYIGHTIYLIKPDQKRYWTRSLALRDADEMYVDVMKARGVEA